MSTLKPSQQINRNTIYSFPNTLEESEREHRTICRDNKKNKGRHDAHVDRLNYPTLKQRIYE